MSVIKLYAPTTIAVYGPTQSGKTNFVINLLKNASEMFTKRVQEIYYCYEAQQDIYDEIRQVEGVDKVNFHKGMPQV